MKKKKDMKDDHNEETEEIKKAKEEFQLKQKELESKMINGLLQYVREGTMPQSVPTSFMDCYDIIYKFTDQQIGDDIVKYHNDKILKAVIECYEKLKNLTGLDFIDTFISCTEKLNTLIYHMSRIFQYVSNNHLRGQDEKDNTRTYKQDDISEFSMDIYKKDFFNKLKTKVFNALNEILIRDERNGNMEHRLKINSNII